MTKKDLPSRRAVLQGTAALSLPLPLLAFAMPENTAPDAHLLSLWNQWQKQADKACRTQTILDLAEIEARKNYPDQPEMFERIGIHRGYGKAAAYDKIRQFHEGILPRFGATAKNNRIQADCQSFDQWHRSFTSINEHFQLDDLDSRTRNEWGRLHDIENAIIATPAKTALGLLVKLEMATLDLTPSETELDGREKLLFSLLNDTKQLTAGDPSARPLLKAISDRL